MKKRRRERKRKRHPNKRTDVFHRLCKGASRYAERLSYDSGSCAAEMSCSNRHIL